MVACSVGRRSRETRGFVHFPTDNPAFHNSNEGGLFVRLLVEYPETGRRAGDAAWVVYDETFLADGRPRPVFPDIRTLPSDQVRAAFETYDAAQVEWQRHHFPLFSERNNFKSRDLDLRWLNGPFLAACVSSGADTGAQAQMGQLLAKLYHGRQPEKREQSDVPFVVRDAEDYDDKWTVASGGYCWVGTPRTPTDLGNPYLSRPYAAVILLGTTGWSGWDAEGERYFEATRADLTPDGVTLLELVEHLYPGYPLRLATWLDT